MERGRFKGSMKTTPLRSGDRVSPGILNREGDIVCILDFNLESPILPNESQMDEAPTEVVFVKAAETVDMVSSFKAAEAVDMVSSLKAAETEDRLSTFKAGLMNSRGVSM